MVKQKKAGKICEWYESKGFGRVNCDGDLFRLHHSSLPFYADQHSVSVGMNVKFTPSVFNGHCQAANVEIPALEKSIDASVGLSGVIESWFPEKGFGMIKPEKGKSLQLNWRYCPQYANQYSIQVGMKVFCKVGEFNGKPNAIEVQIPALKPKVGEKRTGQFLTWDTDKGYGTIQSNSGKIFRANWRHLPNYAPQVIIEAGTLVIFTEGEYGNSPVAKDMIIPDFVPPVGATVMATDADGEWEGIVRPSLEEGSLLVRIDNEDFSLSDFDKVVVTKLPEVKMPIQPKREKVNRILPPKERSLSPMRQSRVEGVRIKQRVGAVSNKIVRPKAIGNDLGFWCDSDDADSYIDGPGASASQEPINLPVANEPGAIDILPSVMAKVAIDPRSPVNDLPEGHIESAPGMASTSDQNNDEFEEESDVLSLLFPRQGRGSKLRSKYLPLFLEEEVDTLDIILKLDHQQLEELGIERKLDQNKILVRIEKLFGAPKE